MTARRHFAAALSALTITAACGTPAPNPPKTSEPAMRPTPTSEPPPESCSRQPDPFPDLDTAAREARLVVEKYVAAITARDEPTAARYTCPKKNGGLLWISSAGKPITVRDVQSVDIKSGHVRVEIQVEGMPPSPVVLKKVGGTWCVWL